MTHDEVVELLGAIALDAVDADERAEAQRHIDGCPRCRASGSRRVAGALANAGAPAPTALWEGIAGRLHEQVAEPAAPRPAPSLVAAPAPEPTVARRRLGWRAGGALVGAAAAAIMIVLGAQVASLHGQVGALQRIQASSGLHQAVIAALADPDATHVELTAAHLSPSVTGHEAAEVVILPDGQAFLVDQALQPLPANRTYQLWGVRGNDKPVSLGVMGTDPTGVPFVVNPSAKPALFAVTIERAGGVVSSTQPIVAEGRLPS